jgi:hypothetical protein
LQHAHHAPTHPVLGNFAALDPVDGNAQPPHSPPGNAEMVRPIMRENLGFVTSPAVSKVTKTKEVVTLLVNSRWSIFNAIKGSIARGRYSISLISQRHMQAWVSARF